MKNFFLNLVFPVLVISMFVSCESSNDAEPDSPLEYNFIRLLVSDENTKTLTLVNPKDGSIQSFESKYPKSSLYMEESGRFAGIIHRDNNMLETFDTGFESHGDHVDIKGTPKFGAMVGESKQPTHFKSKKGEILTFNDGDGTMSVGKVADIHVNGMKLKQINAGNVAHHGAMATFSNGTYAITEKDGSIAGTLPERVKVIDNTGKQLFASKIATKGIHGNATDGRYAVFGSASGILVVESNGEQKLIPNPTGFDAAWFGTILETYEDGKFIGYTAAKGAYLIDVVQSTIAPVIENTDIMQCKVDLSQENLAVLLHSGEVRIYDLRTKTLKVSGSITQATDKSEKQKPTLEATRKYVYVVLPKTGEVLQAETKNLSNVKKIKVSSTPYRIAILGAEINTKGDD
ncbi:MAG: hypothetical protein ACRCVT_02730 [Leadbetterella sp.]